MAGPVINVIKKTVDAAKNVPETPLQEKKKLSIPVWLIVLLLSQAALGGTGYQAYVYVKKQAALAEAERLAQKKAKELEKVTLINHGLGSFQVNLTDTGPGLHHLEVQIFVETDKLIVRNEINNRMPMIRDELTLLLSARNRKELQTLEGRKALQDDIIKKMNQILTRGKVLKIYFSDFLISQSSI